MKKFGLLCLLHLSIMSLAQTPDLVLPIGHTYSISATTLSADGKYLGSGDISGTIILWDVATGKRIRTFYGLQGIIKSISFPDHPARLMGVGEDGNSMIWDLATGQLVDDIRIDPDWRNKEQTAYDFSPGNTFIYLYEEYTGRKGELWDVRSGKLIKKIDDYITSTYNRRAFSADERYFAIYSRKKDETYVFETRTGEMVLKGLKGEPVFSQDGDQLAIGGEHSGNIWDLNAGKEVAAYQGRALSLSSDGRYLTIRKEEKHYCIDAMTGKVRFSFQETPAYHPGFKPVNNHYFSPDGRYLLTCSSEKGDAGASRYLIDTWDILSGKKVKSVLKDAPVPGLDLGFSWAPDSQSFFLLEYPNYRRNGYLSRVYLHRPTGTGSADLPFDNKPISSLQLSADGRFLTTINVDKSVTLWDLTSGWIQHFRGHSNEVAHAAFSPDGRSILTNVSTVQGIWVKSWETISGRHLHAFGDFRGAPNVWLSAILARDNTYSYLASFIDYYDPAWQFSSLQGIFSPDGRYVLTGSGTASLWDTQTGALVQTYQDKNKGVDEVTLIAFSPDGQLVLTRTPEAFRGNNRERGESYDLWDTATGKHLRTLTSGNFEPGAGMIFLPNGKHMITWDTDHFINYVDVHTGKLVNEQGNHHSIQGVSSDGKYVMENGIFNTETQQMVRFTKDGEELTDFVFFPGGRILVTKGKYQGAVIDPETNEVVETLKIPKDFPTRDVSIGAGGRFAFSLSDDRMAIDLWDLKTGRLAHTLRGHRRAINYAQFSPDDQWLLSTSQDHTTKLWKVADGQEIATRIDVDATDWIVTSPSGLFDASPGAMSLMHDVVFHQGNCEIKEVEPLKDRRYAPGLLQKLLGDADTGSSPSEEVPGRRHYPEEPPPFKSLK